MRHNSLNSLKSCRLGFLNRWSLDSLFWGLKHLDNQLVLDREVFSCCGGDGIIVAPENPRDAMLCGLSKRWSLISSLAEQAVLGRGQEAISMNWLKRPDSADALGLLDRFFTSNLDQLLNGACGRFFSPQLESMEPTAEFSWTVAAILGWHFETVVLVADLNQPPLPIHRWQQLMNRFPKSRVIVLVEGASELWIPARLEAMEMVVAFASERRLPVWIREIAPTQANIRDTDRAKIDDRSRSFKAAISKRIENQKKKSVASWLSAQGRSRLRELCVFYEAQADTRKIPDFL